MLFGSNCKLSVPLPRGAMQTNANPPRILLTTNALFENQTWMCKRLGEGASSALDKGMGSKGQNCVSAFQTKLKPETQHAPDHQYQVGVCESKEKRTFESHFRTEKSELNASGMSQQPCTEALKKAVTLAAVTLKYRQSLVTELTLGTRGNEASGAKAEADLGEPAGKNI